MAHPEVQRKEWVVELRDPATKQVSFAALDTGLQKVLWEVSPPYSDWWSSLTAMSGDQVYIHDYRYPEIPEPTDLRALSLLDGSSLWELANQVLVEPLEKPWLKVAGRQGRGGVPKYSVVDANTGAYSPFKEESLTVPKGLALQAPVLYKDGEPYFEPMKAFIATMTDGHSAISIDYLEWNPFMMFSYYIYQQEKLIQFLLVVNKSKELIFHEQISAPSDGIGQATMLMKEDLLVFLKNKNEFSSLKFS
ncbi:DUF4905 domain-containing protein [Dyadobacter jejuensis]|uniref:DUF4905 domain-containing protein n=1 Tax=Dyadobacter jejuensis TaxID=1082580 RepID=UPI001304844E|nr:DUF4905 domain-containing protein [Dyadobacter jejuensis]